MTSSLVGSEMCIRDSFTPTTALIQPHTPPQHSPSLTPLHQYLPASHPVSYTHLTLPTICSV
eukprot:5212436-Prorocentrum_lima.AAC.1